MQTYNKKFKQLIQKSKNILILTHKSPDVDAFCSMIMMKKFLEYTFPKKNVVMKARQMPSLSLPCMKEIKLVSHIEKGEEDLVIITDAGSLPQCLDLEKDPFSVDLDHLVFIDHHTEGAPEENALTINEMRSSASEQVFAIFKDILGRKFKLPKEIAELTQYGIVADTGRFIYSGTTPDTLRIFADAKEVSSVELEEMSYKIGKFPREATEAIIVYLKTLTIQKDMAYMYISKDMIVENNLGKTGVNEAQSFLRDKYIRFIQGVHWGFIIKPDFDNEDTWFVSFRGTKGYQDVGKIAKLLGGGGHEFASASPIKAKTVEEALQLVLNAIEKSETV